MEIEEITIAELVDKERNMVLQAEAKYGKFCAHAFWSNRFLSDCLESIDRDQFIFAMFLAQLRKHHLLAIFSALRLHHTQSMMNSRQVLEAGACAAFAIAHTEPEHFADVDEHGLLNPTQSLANKRHKWLSEKYPKGSGAIRAQKNIINEWSSHSNIVNAHMNFEADINLFRAPFFDKEDEHVVKTNLWFAANIAMGLVDLFFGINSNYGGIKFKQDFVTQLKRLAAENDELKTEQMETDRYKSVAEKLEK